MNKILTSPLRGFLFWLLVCTLLAVGIVRSAEAQTVTLTPSVTSGNGSLEVTLTWLSTPAASSCTASGHSSWTGEKDPSGEADLPPITLSGTYSLTLACTWPGDTTATVSWTAPTTNTDGSPLAKCASAESTGPCLARYQVYRRVGTMNMEGAQVTPVNDPNALSHVYTGLGAGTHYFASQAVNGDGVPSELSNITSKVITAAVSRTESVTITVNPKPSPTVTTVE